VVTSDKVRENRRSRRERARWHGGRVADGYRTHLPECPGRTTVVRDGPDGVQRSFSVRGCSCPTDVLHRDPAREATIAAVWDLLARSPLSWEGLADALNEAGYRRRSGAKLAWVGVHRIGENPHYAGIMTCDRWEDSHDVGRFARLRPLSKTSMRPSEGSIVNPYVSEDEFWRIHRLRYEGDRRHLRRSKRGGSNELTGLVYCPACGGPMTSEYGMSKKTGRKGRPREAPIKRYAYILCARAKVDASSCAAGRKRYTVAAFGKALVEQLAATAVMDDAAIIKALQLRDPGRPRNSLQREQPQLESQLAEADVTRRFLQKERALERITDDEYQRDLFDLRSRTEQTKRRLEEIEAALSSTRGRPSFALVRRTVAWLSAHWASLTIAERGEAFRLLVARVTVSPDGLPKVLQYGPGFVDAPTRVRLGAAG
jgi:hypothetical protein